jgi:hypothetical protein
MQSALKLASGLLSGYYFEQGEEIDLSTCTVADPDSILANFVNGTRTDPDFEI